MDAFLKKNPDPYLSIDEAAFSSGELYIIVTNKAARGRKSSLVAVIKGTQADRLIAILMRLPEHLRKRVWSEGHSSLDNIVLTTLKRED